MVCGKRDRHWGSRGQAFEQGNEAGVTQTVHGPRTELQHQQRDLLVNGSDPVRIQNRAHSGKPRPKVFLTLPGRAKPSSLIVLSASPSSINHINANPAQRHFRIHDRSPHLELHYIAIPHPSPHSQAVFVTSLVADLKSIVNSLETLSNEPIIRKFDGLLEVLKYVHDIMDELKAAAVVKEEYVTLRPELAEVISALAKPLSEMAEVIKRVDAVMKDPEHLNKSQFELERQLEDSPTRP